MEKSKKRLIIVVSILLVLLLLTGGVFAYLTDYYPAEEAVWSVENLQVEDNVTVLPGYADIAVIFYPGAKVEAEAYLPLLDRIRQTGVTCFLVDMPFHMAIFDPNAAEDVMANHPEIAHWYIMGHSMGGAMASQFAADHPEQIKGLILLGAYPYGEYPVEKTLTIYGSLNESVAEKIDYTENVVVIQGGNHAQFGNYGPQRGDAPAEISAEEQQKQAAAAIADFLWK